MIYYFTPYSTVKNLGAEYNRYMALLTDDNHAVFMDGDTMFLTPDYGMIIAKYVEQYPDTVLTCWTNRIHELAIGQLDKLAPATDSIADHIRYAKEVSEREVNVTPITGPVSGFLMVVPKRVWLQHKFTEVQVYAKSGPYNLLGVDNEFTNGVRVLGIPVLRMNSIYIFHTYRLLDGSKAHLL